VSQRSIGEKKKVADVGVVSALRHFCNLSMFRRCCLEMLAWSLSNQDRALVREDFIAMDANRRGTIVLAELGQAMKDERYKAEEKLDIIFAALDYNHDMEIHYSDFLAAMVSTKIDLHDRLISNAFRRFDADDSGYITAGNLREILGTECQEQAEAFIREADHLQDGQISLPEFAAYLRGTQLEVNNEQVMGTHLERPMSLVAVRGRQSSPLASPCGAFAAFFRFRNQR